MTALSWASGVDTVLKSPRGAIGRIVHMSAILGASNVLAALMGLATSLVIARGLGRDEFGRWIFCTAAVSALTTAFDLGFGVLLTRDAARGAIGPLLAGALATRLALFLPFGLILYIAAPAVGVGAASAASIHVGLAWAVAGIAYECVAAVFRTSPRRVLAIMTIETLGVAGRLVGAVVLIRRGVTIPGLLGLAAGLQLEQLAAAFALWQIIAPADHLARPSVRSAWTMLLRAFPFALTGLVANAQARIAPLMLGYLSSAGETASFGVAWRIGVGARRLPQAALSAGMPVFARELQEGRPESVRWKFDSMLRAFAFAAAVGLVVLATPIVRMTYGPTFTAASPALAWIGVGLVPWLINTNRKMHLYASGRERAALRWSAASLAIQSVGCVVLIPRLGAMGAAVALLIGEAFAWLPLRAEDTVTASW